VAALLANELIARAGGGAAEHGRLLDLVALGTIADYGDCSRSNRAMIVHGLRACARGDRPAVAEVARRLGVRDPFAGGSARRLAGVFAAVPSVAGASKGLDALLGRSGADAALDELLEAVDRTDEERARAVRAGEKAARAAGVHDGAPAVLTLEGVRSPFLGAVAQSLVEETGRPAAVLREADGQLVAELRGPESVHLVDVLAAMSELLETWGGHRRAAGFSARASRAEEVVQRLRRALDVPPDDAAETDEPEAELTADDVDETFLASLAAARPFGKGNPEPRLRVGGEIVPAEELLERHGVPGWGPSGAESAP
jgi:single-stranded-DNA-specific exonuclease